MRSLGSLVFALLLAAPAAEAATITGTVTSPDGGVPRARPMISPVTVAFNIGGR
jgi:hypothetical protein